MPNKNEKNTSNKNVGGQHGRKPPVPNKKNKNTSYYRSQVKKKSNAKSGYNFGDRAKMRQTNSYIRAVTLVIVLLIIFGSIILLGMYLKKTIENYRNENILESTEENTASENPPTENALSQTDIDTLYMNETDSNENPQTEVVDIVQIYNSYNGVYLDISKLADIQDLKDFITYVKSKGINAVMIDIKRADGVIPYNSSVSTAAVSGSVVPNLDVDIREAIMILHENDMYVSGLLTCFKDNLVATTFREYSLADISGLAWADSEGGRWLNVYSEKAREYIKELAVEAVNMKMDEIILDSFFLPNTNNPEKIDYKDNGVSKRAVIKDFIEDIYRATEDASLKSKLGINIPLRYFLVDPQETTGISAMELIAVCDFLTTSFAPADLPSSLEVNGKKIASPQKSVYSTVDALCTHFSSYFGIKMFRPMLQAFDTSELKITDGIVSEQKRAVNEFNINVWTLINRDNDYNFNDDE